MDGRIRKFANTLTSFSWIQSSRRALQTNMAYSKVVASLLVALISSLISCVQINAAVINLRNQYIRNRQDVLRLLSMNSCHHKVKKRANHHRRRFWTRPGRTSALWDNFINGTMIEEEWKENFRMSKTSLLKLAEELRPSDEGGIMSTVSFENLAILVNTRFPVDAFGDLLRFVFFRDRQQ